MVVYVDDMWKSDMGRFRRMKMSHMIGLPESEAHTMARKIGVARKWYQGDHYDICLSKRDLAVSRGAVEVTMNQMAGIRWCIREDRKFKSPQQALDLMLRRIRPRGKS